MKRIYVLLFLLFGFVSCVLAGPVVKERHTFYKEYDPSSNSFVYDSNGVQTTGDQVAVNTYLIKTIQINAVANEYITVQIEGRSLDSNRWAILNSVSFGSASSNTDKNISVDISDFVDFIRVGVKKTPDASGASSLNVYGIFAD